MPDIPAHQKVYTAPFRKPNPPPPGAHASRPGARIPPAGLRVPRDRELIPATEEAIPGSVRTRTPNRSPDRSRTPDLSKSTVVSQNNAPSPSMGRVTVSPGRSPAPQQRSPAPARSPAHGTSTHRTASQTPTRQQQLQQKLN